MVKSIFQMNTEHIETVKLKQNYVNIVHTLISLFAEG